MLDLSNKKEEVKDPAKPLITPKAIVAEEVEKSVSTFAIVCLLVVVISTGLFYGFKVYQDSRLKHSQAVYADDLITLNAKDMTEIDKTVQSLQKGIIAFQNYLSGQSNYSRALQELQKDTPKNVKLNNFSISDKGEVKMDGEASDYVAVAKAMTSYTNSNYFTNVVLVSSSSSTSNNLVGKVTFSLTMKLNKDKLK